MLAGLCQETTVYRRLDRYGCPAMRQNGIAFLNT